MACCLTFGPCCSAAATAAGISPAATSTTSVCCTPPPSPPSPRFPRSTLHPSCSFFYLLADMAPCSGAAAVRYTKPLSSPPPPHTHIQRQYFDPPFHWLVLRMDALSVSTHTQHPPPPCPLRCTPHPSCFCFFFCFLADLAPTSAAAAAAAAFSSCWCLCFLDLSFFSFFAIPILHCLSLQCFVASLLLCCTACTEELVCHTLLLLVNSARVLLPAVLCIKQGNLNEQTETHHCAGEHT